MPSPPLQGRYAPMLAVALLGLVPFILIVSGSDLYRSQLISDIGGTRTAVSIISGVATGGYAFGALLAGDLVHRIPQRVLFHTAQGLLILGWALIAAAQNVEMFGAGRVLAGFATGSLLVTALPPVVQQFPPSRLPLTAAFINIGFFGAIAGGPILGGVIASFHAWRIIYITFAALGLFNVLLALLSLPPRPPNNPDLPFDWQGLSLGLAGTVLPFWASGELAAHGFGSVWLIAPLTIGMAAFIALLLVEYHKREPLAPVKKMWTTLPVVGTIIAMIGGGVFVTFVLLAIQFQTEIVGSGPLQTGLSFWPQLLGAFITAALLGLLFRSRYLPVLAFAGMLMLIAGGTLLAVSYKQSGGAQILAATGLLGLGAGATVSPALFLAGFSLPVSIIGRIFALIELVRSVADFIMSPVLLKIAKIVSSGKGLSLGGLHEAMLITISITIFGAAFCLVLYLAGGAGLQAPDLQAWIKEGKPALHSPDLAALLRGSSRREAEN